MAKKKVFQISNALTEGLEETITAAHNYSGELRIDVIPIKRIEVDPDNPRDLMLDFHDLANGISESDQHYLRKSEEFANLQSMAKSIREQGIINPIVVYKQGDTYRLVAGERRTLASIIAGKSEIQAKILDSKPNELKISLLQWIENVERSDLTLWERLKNLEKIVTLYATKKGLLLDQVTITEISNLIGCTKPHAINYKNALLADASIKQLVQDNKIKNLEKVSLISNLPTPELRQHFLEACLKGTSLKKLKAMADIEQRKALRVFKHDFSKRGRRNSIVNFGATKNIKVAKLVLDSIFKNDLTGTCSKYFVNVDWNDYTSVTQTFKQVIKKLEEICT